MLIGLFRGPMVNIYINPGMVVSTLLCLLPVIFLMGFQSPEAFRLPVPMCLRPLSEYVLLAT